MRPIINLDDLRMESCGEGTPYQHSYGIICETIGAQKLGYNLTVVAPGKKANFFHNHHSNEEMFFIIEGLGLLRFGEEEFQVKANDIIACPPGKKEVAHQLINNGNTDLKYLSISTKERVDVTEFPDSNKISVSVGDYSNMEYSGVFKQDSKVPYDLDER